MRRKSLERKIEKLEIAVDAIRKANPEPVILGRLTLNQILVRLMHPEKYQLLDLIEKSKAGGLADELRNNMINLIEIAHDRHDKGLIAARRRRTMEECYSDMKQRRAAGEDIYYGDIERYDEYLEEE